MYTAREIKDDNEEEKAVEEVKLENQAIPAVVVSRERKKSNTSKRVSFVQENEELGDTPEESKASIQVEPEDDFDPNEPMIMKLLRKERARGRGRSTTSQ